MATKNRTVDMRGIVLEVAGLEIKPTVNANSAIPAGSTKLLTATDSGAIVELDTVTGSVVTLPAGSTCGIGTNFTFVVKALATSNSHKIQVANSSDIMVGVIQTIDTDTSDAVASWGTAAASDTITLNRSTTGSVRTGETITATYVATNRWQVDGVVTVTGVPATPFSAAV